MSTSETGETRKGAMGPLNVALLAVTLCAFAKCYHWGKLGEGSKRSVLIPASAHKSMIPQFKRGHVFKNKNKEQSVLHAHVYKAKPHTKTKVYLYVCISYMCVIT